MLNNLKIKSQLALGFGAVLVLLVAISVVGYIGLSSTYKGYVEYRTLSSETNLASRIQTSMLAMRIAVLRFLESQSPEHLDDFNSRNDQMRAYFQEAREQVKDPKRAEWLQSVDVQLQQYEAAFDEVVKLYERRHKLVKEDLDPAGLAMRKANSEILSSAYADGDTEAAYLSALVQQHLLLARLYANKFLVSNDPADSQRAIFELSSEMPPYLERLDQELQNPTRRAFFQEIIENQFRYLNSFREIEQIILTRNDYIDNTLNRVGPEIARLTEAIKLDVKNEQDRMAPVLKENTQAYIGTISTVALGALLAGALISWLISLSVRRPIGGEPAQIASITEIIASGDLTQNLKLNDADTGIYRSVVEMSNQLRGLIGSIVKTSETLVSSAQSSKEISDRNARVFDTQRETTEQVVVAVEQLSASFKEVARNAAACAQNSELSIQASEQGRVTVDKTISVISELSQNLEISSDIVRRLNEQSQHIDKVVEVIDAISDQTNLLALNAAIEAARAGEHGRGFSVVADEVRQLAKRTQQSTNEIQAIIKTLQEGSVEAVRAMDESTVKARQAVDCSNETDSALADINTRISDVAQMNIQVAAAVEQQSAVSDEISQRMAEISQSISQSSSDITAAKAASSNVQSMATKLGELAGSFKVTKINPLVD